MQRLFLFFLALATFSTTGAQDFEWPHEAPDDWLLAFMDVETTGLVPGYHEMIDIGIVMTDLEGVELGELFIRLQPEYPERTNDVARAVNAFNDNRWRELYHFFVLDIPSMAWSLGFRGLTGTSISGILGVDDEPHFAELHTGTTGARLNARIYRALLAYSETK